jgi:hypothetical protein
MAVENAAVAAHKRGGGGSAVGSCWSNHDWQTSPPVVKWNEMNWSKKSFCSSLMPKTKQTQITKQQKTKQLSFRKTQKGIFLLLPTKAPSPTPKRIHKLYVLQVLLTCAYQFGDFTLIKLYHLPLHNNLWHNNNNNISTFKSIFEHVNT